MLRKKNQRDGTAAPAGGPCYSDIATRKNPFDRRGISLAGPVWPSAGLCGPFAATRACYTMRSAAQAVSGAGRDHQSVCTPLLRLAVRSLPKVTNRVWTGQGPLGSPFNLGSHCAKRPRFANTHHAVERRLKIRR